MKVAALMFSVATALPVAALAEVPPSLSTIEKACTDHQVPKSELTQQLEAEGWVQDEAFQAPSPMIQAFAATLYGAAQLEAVAIEEWFETFEQSDGERFGDFWLTNFTHSGIRLTIGYPLVGPTWCALIGDASLETEIRQLQLRKVDVFPIRFSSSHEWSSHFTRELYRAEFGAHLILFFTMVDKAALHETLLESGVNKAAPSRFMDFIPR